ncbi:hypothetical protein ABVT39_015628 [Epinephelus coioides]
MADTESNKETNAESSSILLAIRSMNKTMTEQFDILEANLASTQASLVSLGNRMTEVEEATSNYDHRLSQVEQACMKMRAENDALHAKVIDLEARSRRHNIRIIGLPEKIENGRPAEFLSGFIPELLGASNFPSPVVVDRAHRLGKQPSEGNAQPCAMIARIHHFQNKEKILQLARQQYPLTYNQKAIHLFPDFPMELIKQRQAFDEVRKKLKDAGARVGFIYPARLKDTLGNSEKVFSSPQEAEAFLENVS